MDFTRHRWFFFTVLGLLWLSGMSLLIFCLFRIT